MELWSGFVVVGAAFVLGTSLSPYFVWGWLVGFVSLIFLALVLISRLFQFPAMKSEPPTPISLSHTHTSPDTPAHSVTEKAIDSINVLLDTLLRTIPPHTVSAPIVAACENIDWISNVRLLYFNMGEQPTRVIRWLHTHRIAPDGGIASQLRVEAGVDLASGVTLQVAGELVVNFPVPAACALPVRLTVTGLRFRTVVAGTVDQEAQCAELGVPEDQEIFLDFELSVECGVDMSLQDSIKIRTIVRRLLLDTANARLKSPNRISIDVKSLFGKQ